MLKALGALMIVAPLLFTAFLCVRNDGWRTFAVALGWSALIAGLTFGGLFLLLGEFQ